MDIEDKIGCGIIILMAIFVVGGIGILIGNANVDVRLNQETADDICRQLTNDSIAVGSDNVREGSYGEGKLICLTPSFDSTQNIIVKTNG